MHITGDFWYAVQDIGVGAFRDSYQATDFFWTCSFEYFFVFPSFPWIDGHAEVGKAYFRHRSAHMCQTGGSSLILRESQPAITGMVLSWYADITQYIVPVRVIFFPLRDSSPQCHHLHGKFISVRSRNARTHSLRKAT